MTLEHTGGKMTQNDALETSCLNCIHYRMCRWRGEPYTGTSSGGFPANDYEQYRREWYQLHARNCVDFHALPEEQSLGEHIRFLNSIIMLKTGNPLFTHMVERYAKRHGLDLEDLEGRIVGYPEGAATT